MKKIKILFLTALTSFALFSCSGEESECSITDWLGTYTLQGNETCIIDNEGTVIEAIPILVITRGATDNSIVGDGITYTLSECSANSNPGSLTLDGNLITAEAFGCEFIYTK